MLIISKTDDPGANKCLTHTTVTGEGSGHSNLTVYLEWCARYGPSDRRHSARSEYNHCFCRIKDNNQGITAQVRWYTVFYLCTVLHVVIIHSSGSCNGREMIQSVAQPICNKIQRYPRYANDARSQTIIPLSELRLSHKLLGKALSSNSNSTAS